MKNNTKKSNGNYDWFQNGGNNKKAKTPKEKIKKVFKIFKIFLYIALAALSLTGCVQSFVIGTTNYSGQGMELYKSKDRITPHVVTYNVDKGKLTQDAKVNYYLNETEDLKEVHDFVGKQGGDLSTWKTENNAVRIIKDGKVLGGKNIARDTAGNPMVVSKSADQAGLTTTFKTTTIKVYKYDESKKTYTELKNKPTLKLPTVPRKNKEQKIEAAFETAAFDTLYQTMFIDGGKFNAIYNLLNNTTAGTVYDEKSPEFKIIKQYNQQLNNLQVTTGVVASTNDKWTTFDKATEFTSQTDNGKVKSRSDLAFKLSTKNSLRAIYDWKTSWKLGPFYGLFVYPLSRLVLALVGSFPMMSGWESLLAIAIAVIIIRTFAYMLTFKSTLQQVKQQELSSKKAAIEAKYAQYKGNKQMEQRKRQEMSEMFKKEGISPLGSIGSIFLTMPIFLAMWKIIGGIPHLKSTSWLGIHFSQTSWRELFHGEFQYLPLMLVAATVQGISIYIPRLLTKRRDKNRINAHQKAALKKANKTQNIMMAVFVFMALIFSAGLQVYWIFGGLFTIVQNLVNHKIIKWQSKRNKQKRIKAV
ncbi:membrane protein insertase YidC [Mycoplasma todarodis]|uniref:membrane protein insertase YidC n=1 Tax=Mycoplasma todarodis TaxID=1937191 RepID=UPI003B32170F